MRLLTPGGHLLSELCLVSIRGICFDTYVILNLTVITKNVSYT